MKLIRIQIGSYGSYLLLTPKEAAPILEILSKSTIYDQTYEGSDYVYKKTDNTPEIGFVDDSKIVRNLADHAADALKEEGSLI